jgi:hypothetical protein
MKNVNGLLSGSDALRDLLQKAGALQRINQQVGAYIGKPLNEHVFLANIRNDTAVVMADSAAWLTRVRYLAPQLLMFFQQEPSLKNLHVTKIEFKVRPPEQSQQTARPPLTISQHSAHFLSQTADTFSDPKLRDAIRRLAKHQSKA